MDERSGGLTHAGRRAAGDPNACLLRITDGDDLTAAESEALFGSIMEGRVSEILIGALLAALRTKRETAAEVVGAARVMRRMVDRVETPRRGLVDTCGTGGDFSGTFNISTTAAFVVAAADIPVAKHGNRAASSRSGSADVLEALGVAVELPADGVGRCIDRTGIGFLYAPRFHPAMRHAIGVRRAIAVRTIFNLLGPLTNPAGANRQVIGVPTPDAVELIAGVLAELGCRHGLVVHGLEGLDEISVCGPTRIARVVDGEVTTEIVEPSELGFVASFPAETLAGGDAVANAAITRAILAGDGTAAQSAVVAANAGAGILVGGGSDTLREGVDRARDILESGAAFEVLEDLVGMSNVLAAEA